MVALDDAITLIVKVLRDRKDNTVSQYGYDVFLPSIASIACTKFLMMSEQETLRQQDAIYSVFMEAAWCLVRQGILRPGVRNYSAQVIDQGSGGGGFCLTTFGRAWLANPTNNYEVPIDPSRFGAALSHFAPRFGNGFLQKGQEAITCYNTSCYLACCAMCGAAAESIFLKVAINKRGEEAAVLKDYLASGGRQRIVKSITGQLPDPMKNSFERYADIISYWKDESSHGQASDIDDNQAYTTLITLLRFAHYVQDNWDNLTT